MANIIVKHIHVRKGNESDWVDFQQALKKKGLSMAGFLNDTVASLAAELNLQPKNKNGIYQINLGPVNFSSKSIS